MTKLRPGIDYVGVVANFVCHDGDKFLLHLRGPKARDFVGSWEFGSGQLNLGETIERGVLRELGEEHGVKGKIEKQYVAYSYLRNDEEQTVKDPRIEKVVSSWLVIPFFIIVSKKDIDETREQGKIARRGWFHLNALPKPLHPAALLTLKKCKEQFDKFR